MKIAIHNSQRGFHPYWIKYCEERDIPYKLVDCYSNDIIEQLSDCDALMWHHHQMGPKDILFAKQLLFSLEQAGIVVFPDFNTAWHFDDKVGQKYLLESIDAPLVPSYAFFDKKTALNWLEETSFPKVFKLRGGAGSANVRLVKNKREARILVQKAFGRGFSQYEPWSNLKERMRKFKMGSGSMTDVTKGIARFAYPPRYSKVKGRQRGYVYFQDFIPNNDCDIRVIVIGNKAFAIKRLVRPNDFRASGSGYIKYEKKHFDEGTIKLSFNIASKLQSQCVAIDYVIKDDKPLIVEINYGFTKEGYDDCEGYWDSQLNWHPEMITPCEWMVEGVLSEIRLNVASSESK